MPETIINSTNFSHFLASFFRFVSSSRSSDEEMSLFANDSRNYNGHCQHIDFCFTSR